MSDIINIGSIRPASIANQPSVGAPPADAASAEEMPVGRVGGDFSEFSEQSIALARAAAEASSRIARIATIRAQIDNHLYETSIRIDGTAARLVDIYG